MAFTRDYKAGAVIYFEGDNSEEIYVLKSGDISLNYRGIETIDYVTERLRVGDFFGVKSAMGRYKREETAHVKSDTTVLVLSLKEFEELASKNINLVLKMLKIFSTQLRKIGKQAAKLISTTDEATPEPSISLFQIGEYYLKNKNFDQAKYAFHKYIEHFPNGRFVEDAKGRIDMAQSGVSSGFTSVDTSSQENLSDDLMDDMEDPKNIYNEAMSMIAESKFKEALEKLNDLVTNHQNTLDPISLENVKYELSHTHFQLENYRDAIDLFTNFIKENPKTGKMKNILFYIGQSYHKIGEDDKAKGFFTKVAGLPPENEINEQAKQFLSKLKI